MVESRRYDSTGGINRTLDDAEKEATSLPPEPKLGHHSQTRLSLTFQVSCQCTRDFEPPHIDTLPEDMRDTTFPFEIRVHRLESRIFGLDHAGPSAAGSSSSRTIQRRIEDIEEALQQASQGSDALRRLIEGCRSAKSSTR